MAFTLGVSQGHVAGADSLVLSCCFPQKKTLRTESQEAANGTKPSLRVAQRRGNLLQFENILIQISPLSRHCESRSDAAISFS